MVNFTREKALEYQKIMNQAADSLTDEQAISAPLLFEQWQPNVEYKVDKRLCHNGVLYKVLQTHISQDDWAPDVAVSLFAEVLIPDPTTIPDWVQPSSTNPYMIGDKVRHNEKIWVCVIDYNIWEPGVYGWDEVV